MPRKRMIHPEIWHDRKYLELSDDAAYLWICVITHADDEGIIEYSAHSFSGKWLRRGKTEEKVRPLLDELKEMGFIVQYGDHAFLPNWFKHQSLNKPQFSKLHRPPRALAAKHPVYIEGWERTFKTPYPEYSVKSPVLVQEQSGSVSVKVLEDSGNIPVLVTECSGSTPVTVQPRLDKGSIDEVSIEKSKESMVQPDGTVKYTKTTGLNGEAIRLARLFLELRREQDPKFKKYEDAEVTRDWAMDIQELNRHGDREWDVIEEVIRWVTKRSCWWYSVITSGQKLREKFDQLYAKMDQEKNPQEKAREEKYWKAVL